MTIMKTFMAVCGGACLLAITTLILVVNYDLGNEIEEQYRQKAEVLLYSMKAVRSHVGGVVRPEATKLLEKEDFVTELQSTSFAANGVFSRIPEPMKHGITFRTVSTKPLNPTNRATSVEAELIGLLDRMHADNQKELIWKGVKSIKGIDTYVIAVGEANKKSCLPCHSRPEDAPKSLRGKYAFDSPHRLENRVETAEVAYIPLSTVSATVMKSSRTLLFIGLAGIATVLAAMYLSFSKLVGSPLARLERYAAKVDAGNLDASAEGAFRAELGRLKQSMERMVDSLRHKVRESSQKEEEARLHAQQAEENHKAVTVAREQAQAAHREGLRTAASKLMTITERIRKNAGGLTNQVNRAVQGAQDQQHRLEEAASTVEEINASVLQVAADAREAANSSEDTKRKALEGAEIVNRSVEAINMVNNMAASLKGNMTELGGKAEAIGQVIGVINDIADQTNLLALNAAIEAARAGDAGRGFAVVADEVRKLAEKTVVATKEVAEHIKGIQAAARLNVTGVDQAKSAVDAATELAGSSGHSLSAILTLAGGSAGRVQDIAAAANQQAVATDNVRATLEKISQTAADYASGMAESAKAAMALDTMAEELRTLIHELEKD
ncbi:methyl-accepting chemotaxis protein [Desulfocurvibacter africanus]|uniref:methyl-accepting chemotaxis protein n=1 Tax=Desulfocurvibacter africanus TaxID=873 RepID=UPI00041DA0D0|nr:methyl-accepting chemotaxis protein [Desulfocurvibacter africanus]